MLRMYFAGRITVELDGAVLVRERQLRRRQERLAFAYLVLERGRPVSREELAAVLWPEEPPDAWATALSTIVSRLRSLLSGGRLRGAGVEVLGGAGQYEVRLPADGWVDVEAAHGAVDVAEGALRAGAPRRAFGPATVGTMIARRPFLPGMDAPWASAQRGRLERARLRALECLARVWLEAGEAALAEEAATEALSVDPLRERSHQLLMRAHAAAGNPSKGVQAYHRLRELLLGELGTDPSKETESLYLELLG